MVDRIIIMQDESIVEALNSILNDKTLAAEFLINDDDYRMDTVRNKFIELYNDRIITNEEYGNNEAIIRGKTTRFRGMRISRADLKNERSDGYRVFLENLSFFIDDYFIKNSAGYEIETLIGEVTNDRKDGKPPIQVEGIVTMDEGFRRNNNRIYQVKKIAKIEFNTPIAKEVNNQAIDLLQKVKKDQKILNDILLDKPIDEEQTPKYLLALRKMTKKYQDFLDSDCKTEGDSVVLRNTIDSGFRIIDSVNRIKLANIDMLEKQIKMVTNIIAIDCKMGQVNSGIDITFKAERKADIEARERQEISAISEEMTQYTYLGLAGGIIKQQDDNEPKKN